MIQQSGQAVLAFCLLLVISALYFGARGVTCLATGEWAGGSGVLLHFEHVTGPQAIKNGWIAVIGSVLLVIAAIGLYRWYFDSE